MIQQDFIYYFKKCLHKISLTLKLVFNDKQLKFITLKYSQDIIIMHNAYNRKKNVLLKNNKSFTKHFWIIIPCF